MGGRQWPSTGTLLLICAWALVLVAGEGAGNVCANYADASWLEMFGWVSAGRSPRWEVMDGGRTVLQYINSQWPGFYVSDEDDIINVVITGTIFVDTYMKDDDYIGIGLGYHYPMPGELTTFDTLLFSWGGYRDPQTANHELGGMVIQNLRGVFPFNYSIASKSHAADPAVEPCFWDRTGAGKERTRQELGCFTVVRGKVDKDQGWKAGVVYSFAVRFTESELEVKIGDGRSIALTRKQLEDWCDNNVAEEAREKCKRWGKGRLAWYNFSQNGVRYGNIRLFQINPNTSKTEAPVATPDVYTLKRNETTGDLLEFRVSESAVPSQGFLSNDFSPGLEEFTHNLSTDGSFKTIAGSEVQVDALGGFVYLPGPNIPKDTTFYDYFEYHLETASSKKSEAVRVVFAAPAWNYTTGFELTWDERHASGASFYQRLKKNDVIGVFEAVGACGPIRDWRLTEGGGQGRFSLVPDKSTGHGALLLAADPARLAPREDAEESYFLFAEATDIFGHTSNLDVHITVPPAACGQCPPHSTCSVSSRQCFCDEGYKPQGKCTTYCPGGECGEDLSPTTEDEQAGGEEQSEGSSTNLLFLLFLVLLLVFLCCAALIFHYVRQGKKTTSKRKGARMKSYEIDRSMLEGL